MIACAPRESPPAGAGEVAEAPLAWSFEAPPAWDDRIVIEDADAPANTRARAVRTFSYRSADSSLRPQALLVVARYDSAAWRAVEADRGPPQGDTLATTGAHVFVVALPQSNPFREGSGDARGFDSLRVTLDDARRRFRILR